MRLLWMLVVLLLILAAVNMSLTLVYPSTSSFEDRIVAIIGEHDSEVVEQIKDELPKVELTPPQNGQDGKDGQDGISIKGDKGDMGDMGASGSNGQDGSDGQSAYEVAVSNGFTGTEAEWLAFLKGIDGADGRTPEFAQLPNGILLFRYIGDTGWEVVPILTP